MSVSVFMLYGQSCWVKSFKDFLFIYLCHQYLEFFKALSAAAQELSQAVSTTKKAEESPAQVLQKASPGGWRDIVQQRIESKTRRFGHGPTKPSPEEVVNKFAAVSGHFFYPLMVNFDRFVNSVMRMEDMYLIR